MMSILKSRIKKTSERLLFKSETILRKADIHIILKIFQDKIEITWQDLRIASILLGYKKDHIAYESMLKKYDQDLILLSVNDSVEASFVDRRKGGYGSDALNSYRKLKIENSVFFEKIYANDSVGLEKFFWFNENIQYQINENLVCTPNILDVRTGKYLTAVYYEYISLKKSRTRDVLEKSIEIVACFDALRLPPLNEIPSSILDMKLNKDYRGGFRNALFFLRKSEIKNVDFLFTLEKVINRLPRQFNHGDLTIDNFYLPNYVVDWDSAGVYPLGYDVAWCLAQYGKFESLDKLELFLEKSFKKTFKNERWDDFLLSTLYLNFIFSCRSLRASKSNCQMILDNYHRVIELVKGKDTCDS